MATHGFFTLHDLYAGKAKEYREKTIIHLAFASTDLSSLIPPVDDDWFPKSEDLLESSSTDLTDNVYKVVRQNSFAYFHWLLIALAVFFTVLLTIICIYFCCQHCAKKNKRRNDKKRQSLPSFYRYRNKKRDAPMHNIYESTAPLFFASPPPPTSSQCLDNELLRQGLDAVGTPQSSRTNESVKESTSAFTSSATDLLTEMKDRLGTRSSKSSFETQRANMAFKDEPKS